MATPRSLLLLLLLPLLVACPTAQPEGVTRLGSIAILADTHVGEGHLDYGSEGWDDSGGDPDEGTAATLVEAVAKVNADSGFDIGLVMVLGDLSDSGETSELNTTRGLLEGLEAPWFPLLGNHDMWPYYWSSEDSFVEAPGPTGDLRFNEIFAQQFEGLEANFPSLERAPAPTDDPELGISSSYINYAFDHQGFRFVVLDLNPRTNAGVEYPGIGGDAALHDFPGGTLPWLRDELAEHLPGAERGALVFLHHPPLAAGPLGLSQEDKETFVAAVEEGDPDAMIRGIFAGHWHFDQVNEVAYAPRPLVVAPATKDDASVRIVQLFSDGSVDFGVLR